MNNITSWNQFFINERKLKYFQNIFLYLHKSIDSGKIIYPAPKNIFKAFHVTPFNKIKVVIVGQDPYCGYNQANGLAFSVNQTNILIPPSLINIFIELNNNISTFEIPKHGNLTKWASQGVFLLNSILTVEHNKAGSHINIGWEIFTDKVILLINNFLKGVIFLLWGEKAKKKKNLINTKRHFLLESSHPSPLSVYRGFSGCQHFIKTNNLLKLQKLPPIDWNLI